MKLFYYPGACSLSPHIVASELGIKVQLEKVDLGQKTWSGGDFTTINAKGYVPALQLDNGQVLTEGVAIVQYLADQKPAANAIPANGTFERYRAQEWLNYISTELHKNFSPLFNPKTPDATKTLQQETLAKRFEFVARHLSDHDYLMGKTWSVADAYLYTVLSWAGHVKFDLSKWAPLTGFMTRMNARPGVQNALKAEGLLK